ncbi:MAG TPA: EamA family transporter [Gaiellaceae bacterium]|jgi:drug/metabolite transporter (DMT)-like permease|nr:EamA family transporter [Gaiellaceae bacterium]
MEPIPSTSEEPRARRPLLGYAMVLAATGLWGINGTVSKAILSSGLSSLRLTEVRSTGAALALAAALAVARPQSLRVRRGETLYLAAFGIGGLAFVQLFYFLAIRRLEIGIALLIQYTAPVLLALWARFGAKETVRRRIWVALILAFAGLSLVVDLWGGLSLDAVGVAAALGSAVTFSFYILLAEHAVGRRDPVSLVCLGFAFAAVFWAILQPWWSFPAGFVDDRVLLDGTLLSTTLPVWLLMLAMIVAGTIVPFGLLVGALRHISATRAGVAAMFEPVAGAVVAYAWLGESLSAVQLAGGGLVLVGILLAQTAR